MQSSYLVVRLHHSTRKFARRVEAGAAGITGTTVSYRRGRWLVSFTDQIERTLGRTAHAEVGEPVVGFDVGVRHQVVVSTTDGREIDLILAPHYLEGAQARPRSLNRKAARQQRPHDPETNQRRKPSPAGERPRPKLTASTKLGRDPPLQLSAPGQHQVTPDLANATT